MREPYSGDQKALLISAVIPNYNHASTLPNAVASLQAQTLPPVEIVIVDDGSTDDSIAVIERLRNDDPRIRLIRHDVNRGAIAAINTGIMAATSPFLFMGAADDVTLPHLFERLVRHLVANPGVALACGEVTLKDQSGNIIGLRPISRPSQRARSFTPEQTWALLQEMDNFILTGAALFRRDALVEIGVLRPELGAFGDGFAVRQLALRKGFVFLPERLGEWHINPQGLSRRAATDVGNARSQLEQAMAAFATDPCFPPDYAPLFARRWRFAVLRLAKEAPDSTRNIILEFAPGSPRLRRRLVEMAQSGRVGWLLVLAWATYRLRPTSIRGLIATRIMRTLRS